MLTRLASLLALAAVALAQDPLRRLPMPTALRDAGTYHLATGTWTRAGSSAQLGPDVIYAATRPSGYFAVGWEGAEGADEGILPSTGNPYLGPQDSYVIDGFRFAYCATSNTIDWTLRFFDSYVPCDIPDAPANCMNVAGGPFVLPGLPTAGACWSVTVDLSGGQEVCMQADGGPCAPGYQGGGQGLDHFGWGATWVTDDQALAGPVLAGYDPDWAPPGEGTCYLPGLTCPSGATGLGAWDLFAIGSGGPVGPGCYFFGGYCSINGCPGPIPCPGAQFELTLYTDCTRHCDPCPERYCWEAPDQLGDLTVSTCSLAAGPLLQATGLTGGRFAYHLVGSGQGVIHDPPGAKGDLCLAGSTPGIGRYVADSGPVVADAFATDLVNGATGAGSGALPSPPGGSLAPGQSWNFQTWVRVPGGSRFTPAVRVVFEL